MLDFQTFSDELGVKGSVKPVMGPVVSGHLANIFPSSFLLTFPDKRILPFLSSGVPADDCVSRILVSMA